MCVCVLYHSLRDGNQPGLNPQVLEDELCGGPIWPRGDEEGASQECTVLGTSLVAQWLRIRLPMQGTWVQALVWEDPTCRGATKPMRHNY